jgi:hypothetical protein
MMDCPSGSDLDPACARSTAIGSVRAYTLAYIDTGCPSPSEFAICTSEIEGTSVVSRGRQSRRALPRRLDVDLLRNFDGVIDLDAEVTNGARDLRLKTICPSARRSMWLM